MISKSTYWFFGTSVSICRIICGGHTRISLIKKGVSQVLLLSMTSFSKHITLSCASVTVEKWKIPKPMLFSLKLSIRLPSSPRKWQGPCMLRPLGRNANSLWIPNSDTLMITPRLSFSARISGRIVACT